MPDQERKVVIGVVKEVCQNNRDCEFVDVGVLLKPVGSQDFTDNTIHIVRPTSGHPVVLIGDHVKVTWLTKKEFGPVRMQKLQRG